MWLGNGKKFMDDKSERDYNWREVDPNVLLQNPKYIGLHQRHEERGKQLDAAYSLPTKEERVKAVQRIMEEEDRDEADNLLTEVERKEYLNHFTKFMYLEELREKMDPGMYEILHKFNRLPFSTLSSCSGHVIPGTDRLKEDWFPALTFIGYTDVSPEERDVQRRFINSIDTLSYNICAQLRVEPYNILDLRVTGITSEGDYEEIGADRALENGSEISIYLNADGELGFDRGREILSVVWEEFFYHLGDFVSSPEELPDFKQGDVFSQSK